MSVRSHFTAAPNLLISVFNHDEEIPAAYADDETPETGFLGDMRLVIEDPGNLEAFVIDGSDLDLLRLANDIQQRVLGAMERQ